MLTKRTMIPLSFFACLLTASFAFAGDFVSKTLTDADGDHKYQVYLPNNYSAQKKWPVMVFLHGAGERGTDGQLQTQVGLGAVLKTQPQAFPFVVLFPQCEDKESRLLPGWRAEGPDGKRVLAMLSAVEEEYSIDTERRILTGWSMGGYGVWHLAAAHPDMWSALLPIASGGDISIADQLPKVPTWIIHGQRDNVVRPSAVTGLVEQLQSGNRNAWFTLLPQAGHDAWRVAYGSEKVQQWLQKPTSDGNVPDLSRATRAEVAADDFKPVLELPGAIELRLGNRMLNAFSFAIPARIPKEAVSGRIADIRDSVTAEGIPFSVTFSGITYSGGVTRAIVRASGKNRLQLQFGLTNVSLRIGSTYIRGRGRSATSGPITIAIGTRRPVWLKIDAEPYVKDRQLKLKPLRSSFQIDRDNWFVSRPYSIQTRGWGMTRQRVSNALVDGLYARRSRIEREVVAAVPSMLKWAEQALDLSYASQATRAVWPLPVYQPVSEAWPQAISTDENGISLTLGLNVAAPTARKLPFRTVAAPSGTLLKPSKTETLEVGISPHILGPLSQLLVESDIARINVLDIPGDAFAPLTRRKVLQAVIPQLKDYPETSEIQTELVLKKALNLVTPGSDTSISRGLLRLDAPNATIVVSVRDEDSGEWRPAADLQMQIRQSVQARVDRQEDYSSVQLLPASPVQLETQSGQNYLAGAAIDESARVAFSNLFDAAWQEWISGESFADTNVPAVDLQQTRLRLDDLSFTEHAVVTRFDVPPVIIENLTEEVHRYEVKGPASGWEKFELKPGETHRYSYEYSLTYRWTANGKTTTYTLKPGSESEFRVPRSGGPPTLFKKPLRR